MEVFIINVHTMGMRNILSSMTLNFLTSGQLFGIPDVGINYRQLVFLLAEGPLVVQTDWPSWLMSILFSTLSIH